MSVFTERRDPRPALVVAVLITVAVALLDLLTPAEVDFGECYMLAVILVAWSVGLRAGLLFALLGACAELAVEVRGHASSHRLRARSRLGAARRRARIVAHARASAPRL